MYMECYRTIFLSGTEGGEVLYIILRTVLGPKSNRISTTHELEWTTFPSNSGEGVVQYCGGQQQLIADSEDSQDYTNILHYK